MKETLLASQAAPATLLIATNECNDDSRPKNEEQQLPFDIIDMTLPYSVIKKGNHSLSLPITRVPFFLTDNDRIAIELLPLMLSVRIGKDAGDIWSDLVNATNPKLYDYELQEEELEHIIISKLINLGNGQVTFTALNELAEHYIDYHDGLC
ncbi:MAG: hypothetical protein HWE10_01275 [Gammaproteobacteria bacterium]|nr:hypothetical protein [Gammaproteobacteria bacterium]